MWHRGLIHKLQQFGIQGELCEWFKDYLSNRRQRVIINGQSSPWIQINAGVPQGSVLGPLLFLVYINDITSVIQHCHIRLFADDTCLFINVDNRNETGALINEDLYFISQWAKDWLVDFNAKKTKEMIISYKKDHNQHPELYFNNHVVSSVESHSHLGIILSNNLKWSAHIDEVASKSSK